MFRFLEALPKTTLFYRSDPVAGKAELAQLLLAGTVLLTACRLPLGFPPSTNFILALLGHGTLMIGGLVFLVRGGQDAVQDSMKLSRLLLVTWTVTLVLFVHNFFPSTRVLYGLPGITRALVYAGVATLLIAIHTLMHPLILQHQITPKTSRYTRCSMSMLPNVSINGRIRSSGQLGRWWYSISPCRNSECVRRFTVFAFNQRS